MATKAKGKAKPNPTSSGPKSGPKNRVTVGGVEVELAPHPSYTLRVEILHLASENRVRARAAALGACWRTVKGRPAADYRQCGYSPALFGEAVLNELHERGVDLTEIMQAGEYAIGLLLDGLVSEREVSAEEGNSEGEEAPTR